MMCNITTLILPISMHIQHLVKFYYFVLKILSGNEIMIELMASIIFNKSAKNNFMNEMGPLWAQISHWYPGSGVVLDCIDS